MLYYWLGYSVLNPVKSSIIAAAVAALLVIIFGATFFTWLRSRMDHIVEAVVSVSKTLGMSEDELWAKAKVAAKGG